MIQCTRNVKQTTINYDSTVKEAFTYYNLQNLLNFDEKTLTLIFRSIGIIQVTRFIKVYFGIYLFCICRNLNIYFQAYIALTVN